MKLLRGIVILVSVVVPLSAYAVLINTSIGTYDINYEAGVGDNFDDPIDTQPWHGTRLAPEFAALVGSQLGFVTCLYRAASKPTAPRSVCLHRAETMVRTSRRTG